MPEPTVAELTLNDGPVTRDRVSQAVDAFLRKWKADDAPPPLVAFLPTGSEGLRRIALIEMIKVDLDLRWARGYLKRVEDYLAEYPELNGPTGVPCDLIYEEHLVRQRHATTAPVEEYVRRFPDRADSLYRLFGGPPTVRPARARSGSPTDVAPGQALDDFDLLALIGEGAFARVFLARQRSMQRVVALKVSADHGAEPQTLAQLDHPHVVRVYDQRVLPEKQLRLLYMPYLPGGTLRDVLPAVAAAKPEERTGKLLLNAVDAALARRGEMPPVESAERARIAAMTWSEVVCWIGARLAEALDYAHTKGVLHRDLKPANVLLGADATPRLADFNVSSCSKIEGAGPEAFFGGSLAYMSPEQIEAFDPANPRAVESLDGRSDVYSLAVTLWELLTGSRPFPDEPVTGDWPGTFEKLLARRLAGVDRATVDRLPPDLVPGLLDVLWTCLQPDPDRRYPTAGDLAKQLDLCRKPRARELLHVRPGWRSWVVRHSTLAVLAVCLAVNGLTSLFSIEYNRAALIEPYPAARETFQWLQLVVNGTFFPICTGIMIAYVWPVARVLRDGTAKDRTEIDLARLRRRCLNFGPASVLISFWAWVLAGIIFPVVLDVVVRNLPLAFYAHFLVSQTLCGLVAVSYPQFGVTFLVFRCLYPALLPRAAVTAADVTRLRAIDRLQNVYLILAASVPMLAVGLLAGFGAETQVVLAVLSAVGIVGFLAASQLTAAIRADRAALEELKAV